MNEPQGPKRPQDIESRSFAVIEAEIPEPRPFSGKEWLVVRRLIHTSADFELLHLVRFHASAVQTGIDALGNGALVVTDTEMARMGISSDRLNRLGCRVVCAIRDPEVAEAAHRNGTTRAQAAVDHLASSLHKAVCVIGNAPTALLRLLALVQEGVCTPALIVGMPVGFIHAAESKEFLAQQDRVPFITIQGRKGGSALAAAAVNQLALLALAQKRA